MPSAWRLRRNPLTTPKARRRRRPTAERSDLKSMQLPIDASLGAASFETEKRRQLLECYFLLNFDLRKASKQRFRGDISKLAVSTGPLRGRTPPASRLRRNSLNYRRRRPTKKSPDSKSILLTIDASSGADSFETESLGLSAFQFGIFW